MLVGWRWWSYPSVAGITPLPSSDQTFQQQFIAGWEEGKWGVGGAHFDVMVRSRKRIVDTGLAAGRECGAISHPQIGAVRIVYTLSN